MDANPGKFQGIILGKDVLQSMTLSAQGHDIPLSNHLKVLGVTLDQKLNFDMHIDSICLSAARQINALKRLSRFLDQDSRVLIYKSFVLSNFSYSPITWIFGGKGNSTKLEKLQERALRFVYRDTTSTYEEILKRGDFLPLSIYRLKFLAIEVYRCINNLNPTNLSDLFVHKNVDYELRDPHQLEQPKSNTKNMVIDLSCIMGRNCGTCYQVTLNAPLLYMNFVAKSLNGASPYHQMTLIYFRCIF